MASWIELNNEIKIKDKNGKYQFNKDKEATRAYFLEHVNRNTVFFHNLKEKLAYLVSEDYYDKDILDKYSYTEIKRVFQRAYNKKFRFPSFMSAFKFYNNYALKTNDGEKYLERYEDRISIVALYFADGDVGKAYDFVDVLINQCYQPATPTFLNVGRARSGEKVSCFLLNTPDSTEGIEYVKEASAQLSRRGGGVGISLSRVRSAGEDIKGIENASSGVVGVAKMLESTFNYYNQLGMRKGAGVAYLNIFHPDIDAFLDTKKINADEGARLQTLSIGVLAPSKFFKLASEDKPYFVFYPHSIYKEYGVTLDDINMDEWYDKLVENPNIKKRKMEARQMLNKIAQIQQESGYPYFVFIDNANKKNPLKKYGKIVMSNLCTEIFQVQEISDIKSRDQDSVYGKDISCNLGSLNIVNVMESGDFQKIVSLSMDALNKIAKDTNISVVPTVANANRAFRSVGLGAMNLHGFLAKNRIMYTSREAKDFVNTFFMMVNYYSIKRSMEIAVGENFIFEGFEKSDYADGSYFDKYISNSFSPRTEKVKKLFDGIYIPTQEDWNKLATSVAKHGLAHSYRMATAPTGNISYIQSATASIAPITEQIETRTYDDSTTHYPMPYMTNENMFFYQTAYEMDMKKYIDLIAVAQQHIDQGISTTLYVSSDKTSAELAEYYIYAHEKGLKSLYYTRTKLLSPDECLSCSV